MTTKRELFTEICMKIEEFLTSLNYPHTDLIKQKYANITLEAKVGLIEKYILPAQDVLKEYLEAEVERLKYIAILNGYEGIEDVKLTESQMNELVELLTRACKIF